MNNDEVQLSTMVKAGHFEEAAELCRSRLGDKGRGNYWLRQLGFVCFLDEGNEAAYYECAPKAFRELVRKDPENADAQFWLGYIREIVENDHVGAEEALRIALRIMPEHPYSHLVLAGIRTGPEAIEELETTLALQPGNVHAWRRLAQESERQGDPARAKYAYSGLLNATPFVESGYGIMNAYMNEVLTGATHADSWKRDARQILGL